MLPGVIHKALGGLSGVAAAATVASAIAGLQAMAGDGDSGIFWALTLLTGPMAVLFALGSWLARPDEESASAQTLSASPGAVQVGGDNLGSITTVGAPHRPVDRATVEGLAEQIERAQALIDAPKSTDELSNDDAVEAIVEWHEDVRAFFDEHLDLTYYTTMHNHAGLRVLSGDTRISWSQERTKLSNDLRFDLIRLNEILDRVRDP